MITLPYCFLSSEVRGAGLILLAYFIWLLDLGVCDHVALLFPEQRGTGSYQDEMGSVEAYQENSSTLVDRISNSILYYIFIRKISSHLIYNLKQIEGFLKIEMFKSFASSDSFIWWGKFLNIRYNSISESVIYRNRSNVFPKSKCLESILILQWRELVHNAAII